jgi:hypothetical protein
MEQVVLMEKFAGIGNAYFCFRAAGTTRTLTHGKGSV